MALSLESQLKPSRRRSSITKRLDQQQDEDHHPSAISRLKMASFGSINNFNTDSGFSRLHFRYDEKPFEHEQPTESHPALTKTYLSRYQVLEIVEERSDNSAARSSRDNLAETPDLIAQSMLLSSAQIDHSEIIKTDRCHQRTTERPSQRFEAKDKQAGSYLKKIAGWSLVLLAGGFFVRSCLFRPSPS